jgi:phosphoribosyl 1,2-cyclic phosphodiesterase
MDIKFYGVRGSIPSPGPDTVKYGGNTACVEVAIDDDFSVVFDAGSGIRKLGQDYLINKIMKGKSVQMMLFITHTHWDHIQGFPFFIPAFIPTSNIHVIGAAKVDARLEEVLKGQQQYQYFPVSMLEMPGRPMFVEIEENQVVYIYKPENSLYTHSFEKPKEDDIVVVKSKKLNHPFPGVFAYRLELNGKSVVMATDTEHYSTVDARLVDLAKGADVLIYDCQYTEAVYNQGKNLSWGHSTPSQGLKVAEAAGVKQLVLFHYDPNTTDSQIDKILEDTINEANGAVEVEAAYEGLSISL